MRSTDDHDALYRTSIGRAEWLSAATAVRIADPSETTDDSGIDLVVAAGARSWHVWSPGLVVWTTPTITGDGDELTLAVPRRLVEYAADLVALDLEPSLHSSPDGLEVAAGRSSLHIEHADSPARPTDRDEFDWHPQDTVATIDAASLYHLVRNAARLPTGLSEDGDRLPDPHLVLRGGAITVAIDWAPSGVPSSETRVTADIDGPGDEVRLSLHRLGWILCHADPADELAVWIERGGRHVGVATTQWTAWLSTWPAGMERIVARIERTFYRHQLAFHRLSEHQWTGEFRQAALRIELLAEPAPTVRASTVLAEHVAPTADVLAEVNALSRGLVGTRVWWQDGSILAATDVRAEAVASDLVPWIGQLVDQVAGLGPLVSALGSAHDVWGQDDA